MKNKRFFRGILSFWLVFGLFLAGCEQPVENGSVTGGATRTVTYNANGASGTVPAAQTVVAGDSITVAGQGGLTLAGNTFSGWNTKADGTGAAYAAGSSLTVNANVTLYAQWVAGSGGGDTAVTFNSVAANGSATQTTTRLTLTFNQAITGLSAGDITLSGVSGVSKGTLSGSGPVYTLGISGFSSGGTLSVAVAKPGSTISGSPKTVTIYYASGSGGGDTAVTLLNVIADGADWETTTQLGIYFDDDIPGLSASGITLSGVSGVTKGTLKEIEPYYYTLDISGFTSGGTLNVAVAKSGYTISGSPKTVTIYYGSGGGGGDTAVTFSNVTANGSSSQTTTELSLVFSQPITGLSASDITLNGVSGVSKGTLSGLGPTYTLPISGFTSGGSLSVAVFKSGYAVSDSPKTVAIYYNGGGGGDTAVTFNNVTANGSPSQITTELTLTFSQSITGLSVSDIALSGVSGVSKGTLSGTGPTYTLGISGFTVGGTLSVAVAKPGYDINGSPQSTTIYYYTAPVPQVPSAPTGVTAERNPAGSTTVRVTWNPVSGATGYRVYYSATGSGSGNLEGSPSTTSFDSTGNSASGTHYFRVSAVNSAGEGSPSSWVSVGPASSDGGTTVPGAPTGVTASRNPAGSTTVRVTWNPVSGATGYRVYYSATGSGSGNLEGSPSTTSFDSTGNSASGTHYFRVSAVNSAGEGSPSSWVSVGPASGGPTATKLATPTNLTANSGGSFVQISFNTVSLAQSYQLFRATSATGTYTQITASGGSSGSQYILTDSSPQTGTRYYKVKAIANTSLNMTDSDLSDYVSVTR